MLAAASPNGPNYVKELDMKFYKNEAGAVFAFNEDGTQDFLVTEDMVVMTPAEVLAHTNPPTTIKQQLAKLEEENPITPRNLRELAMLVTEGFKQVTGVALDISQIPGVKTAYDVEAEAAVLRAQL